MIRQHYIVTILQKELLDTVRDKKTLLLGIGLPVVIWPLMAVFMTQVATSHIAKQMDRKSRVAVVGDTFQPLTDALRDAEKLVLVQAPDDLQWDLSSLVAASKVTLEETGPESTELRLDFGGNDGSNPLMKQVETLVGDKLLDVVIALKAEPDTHEGEPQFRVWVLFDSTNTDSMQAGYRCEELLVDLQETLMEQRLDAVGVTKAYLRPLGFTRQNVATTTKTSGSNLGRILPLMLTVLVVLGGFYPAITMTAGEKENGTLPTILCAPVGHLELLMGKYLAILVIVLVGVTANIASMGSVLVFGLADVMIEFPPHILLYILVALVPTAMLYTAMFMAVAICANSFREAQNLLSPVTLIAILPSYAAFLPGIELSYVTAVTPGVNIALLIKQLMVGIVNLDFIVITLLSNLAWTFVILFITARFFEAEQVLLSGAPGVADVLTLDRNAMPKPTASLSNVLFLVYLTGTFYLSGALLRFGIHVMIPVLQVGLFGLLPLLLVRYFRMDTKAALRLRMPRPLAVVGAVLLGCSLFVSTHWLGSLNPPPPEYENIFIEVLRLKDENVSLITLIFLIGVLPGIFEELAFRGLMQSGYQNSMRAGLAVTLTALWFAVAHFSVHNFLPLFVMGLVLSYVAWRSNCLWIGVIIHIINNSLAVVVARKGEWLQNSYGFTEADLGAPFVLAVGVTVSAAGLLLVHISGSKPATAGQSE